MRSFSGKRCVGVTQWCQSVWHPTCRRLGVLPWFVELVVLRTPEQGALEFEEVVVPLTEASETHLRSLRCWLKVLHSRCIRRWYRMYKFHLQIKCHIITYLFVIKFYSCGDWWAGLGWSHNMYWNLARCLPESSSSRSFCRAISSMLKALRNWHLQSAALKIGWNRIQVFKITCNNDQKGLDNVVVQVYFMIVIWDWVGGEGPCFLKVPASGLAFAGAIGMADW